MINNWNKLQTQFWYEGYAVLDNFIPEYLIEKWNRNVYDFAAKAGDKIGVNQVKKVYDTPNLKGRDGKGEYNFISIDGRACFDFEGLSEYYNFLPTFLSLFTGLDIVPSWDGKSAVTFMLYTAPGGQLVPHFDTNNVTFLLYLTDNEDGGTQLYPLDALRPTNLGAPDEIIKEPVVILPKRGRAVIFQGRKVWHSSLPTEKTDKISSVWNYYIHGDNWRPEMVSERLYK